MSTRSSAASSSSPELISMGNSTWESSHAAVLQLLELPRAKRPTAIFAANNRCTIGGCTRCRANTARWG